MANFFKQTVYVQISAQKLTVTSPESGKFISETPWIAINKKLPVNKMVVSIGEDAYQLRGQPDTEVINPFTHPRSLFSDFTCAEYLIKSFIKKLEIKNFFAPNPIIIIHPLVDPEGGFTQIEFRVMRELALGAGASKAIVWVGSTLSNQDIISGLFPLSGKIIE
ncbi:rod shape-determining protein [Solimicrobium silvestre]|uniref:Rod shape-determining protein MreB n=1 Tax=Solimicrobium silvestre TaxID=2099400 RepID=A0A2S9H0J3_9BURK|nr:rod shape-determining protein [Solimicrobium silvestre]PRC93499.1 hypothetical protein S2091_1886 [Solimicrobium silvestre]